MMRSLFSGVSGLRNHQTKMDVIGNNIANVNTQGFKSSRTSFAEVYNQTLSPASMPTGTLGGTNPRQIGLGVSTKAIDVLFTQGAAQSTGRMLDVCINGDGFIGVTKGEGQPGTGSIGQPDVQTYYTRAGNMYLDEDGYLVNANGMYVIGVNLCEAADIDSANPPSDWAPSPEGVVDGSVAKGYYADLFTKNPPYIDYDPNTGAPAGGMQEYSDKGIGRINIHSSFTNIAINKNGVISGMNVDGTLVEIGMITTFNFVNPAGLNRQGDNLYAQSNNSGFAIMQRPTLDNGAPELMSGYLEMSNVDLSQEFTDMIITQRGFQANSRIITVSDTLLEELINLKR